MYMALNSIFGSQQYFLFNHIQALWQDAEHGTIRMAVLSYTTTQVNSMNEVCLASLDLLASNKRPIDLFPVFPYLVLSLNDNPSDSGIGES